LIVKYEGYEDLHVLPAGIFHKPQNYWWVSGYAL
jgi:hypothetical protein